MSAESRNMGAIPVDLTAILKLPLMSDKCNDISAELESWYGRDSGQYLLDNTRLALEPLLDRSFGYHLLQLGVSRQHSLFQSSPINHKIYSAERAGGLVDLQAHSYELPLESDSVDTVIAHHSLEFSPDPHQVLREIQRVLTPQGQLLIIGFNPYSLAGAGAYVRGLAGQPLWNQHRPVSSNRLTDWLRLLGCEVQGRRYLHTVPPVGPAKWQDWSRFCDHWCSDRNLPLGGVYILHAIKQVSAVNRPRNRLRLKGGRLIGLAVPKPGAAPSPTPSVPSTRQGEVAA